jgi:hypothetical protein
MTEAEFLDIAMSHQVTPYVHNPDLTQPGELVPDSGQWCRDGGMPRDAAVEQIALWRSRKSYEAGE